VLPSRLRKKALFVPLADLRGSVTASESAPAFPSRDCEGAVVKPKDHTLAETERLTERDRRERYWISFFSSLLGHVNRFKDGRIRIWSV